MWVRYWYWTLDTEPDQDGMYPICLNCADAGPAPIATTATATAPDHALGCIGFSLAPFKDPHEDTPRLRTNHPVTFGELAKKLAPGALRVKKKVAGWDCAYPLYKDA